MKQQQRQKLPEQMREPLGFITLHDEFIKWKEKKNYSPSTVYHQSYHLYNFFGWCADQKIYCPKDVTYQTMKNYQSYTDGRTSKKGTPLASYTKFSIYISVRAFFRWTFQKQLTLFNPARAIIVPKRERKQKSCTLTHKEIEEILSVIDIATPAGIRNRAIIETLYSTGMRRKELANVTLDDIDLEREIIFIREGKGQKGRLVPIGERAIKWIEKYLYEARPLLATDRDEKALFINNRGCAFPINSFTEIVGDYVRYSDKEGSCHRFRHSAASLMLENGAPVAEIQKLLGHVNIATTHIYTHVSLDKLKEVVDDTHSAIDTDQQQISTPLKPFTHPKGEIPVPPNCKKQINNCWHETHPEGSLVECAKEYIEEMKVQKFCFSTVVKRKQHLKRFLDWCLEREIIFPAQITTTILDCYQSYILHLKKSDDKYLNPSYRQRILISLAAFFRYLFEHDIILIEPERAIDLPKSQRKSPPQILTEKEVEKIFSGPDIETPMGVRNRTILETLYATALHSREVVNLKLGDVDIELRTLHVRKNKHHAERVIPLTERANNWLEKYIHFVRPVMVRDSTVESLFVGRYGIALTAPTLHEILRLYMKKAGIRKTGGCQLFRYTAAITMLENGADIRHVQEFLGHQSLASTQNYTEFAISRLKQVHEQTHPAKIKPTKDALLDLEDTDQ